MRDVEQRIAEIWRTALGAGRADGDAGFTELGGKGIDAVLIAARIQRDLGVAVRPSALFRHPGLADFVTRCRTAAPAAADLWDHAAASARG
ncbi:phosphopantetheine-binding protein [Planobispora longispora]|uniref:Carrier domain-containing protein n=1 Tax=Planobispora longispora TaxID=28887 RepID=A0A8J3RIX0_9ACTN|nr:phosphopantetheine-binding protein [Planobispora longispora]BFE84711.1 hypothetical protein GCM10020093_073120 [Planobispora longispora]GIH75505.1 hypothetical protein Plo01_19340 [Planobispora longispora]